MRESTRLAPRPRVHGETTTVGTRKPSSDLPSTMSVSVESAAAARGGATWSKNPSHSSNVTSHNVLGHVGELLISRYMLDRNASPARTSAGGWSSLPTPLISNTGSTMLTGGKLPAARSFTKSSKRKVIESYLEPHRSSADPFWM